MLDPHDHRSLGQRLDLFHFEEDAPGMVFWHPNGFRLYRLLEDAVREVLARDGYEEVRSPELLRKRVWERSGHWRHFHDGMFRFGDEAALKPVSCPGHIAIAAHGVPSHRDLPLRLAEFGLVHRDEPAGTLHGLLRLRQFTQDDGHVFCSDEEQAGAEVERFLRGVRPFYAAFGFEHLELVLSLRPDDRAGDDASWDRAEGALEAALRRLGVGFELVPGAGAFYGPKIEIVLQDRLGRAWQCGTIQFDLVMPKSFGLAYVAASGERRPAVMLHRALYGSLERFLGVLLEQHAAALPAWLAPEQVAVLPVAPSEAQLAESVAQALRGAGLRVRLDVRDESLSKRIARAHERAAAFSVVIGPREAGAGAVSLRSRNGQAVLPLDDALRELADKCARPAFGAL
jgi:threonyl-tRNA synthetase